MTLNRTSSRAAAAIAAVSGLVLAGGTYAAASYSGVSEAGVISACWRGNGAVRIVDHYPCKSGETPISWNQKGIRGDDGPAGPAGVKGDTGVPGAKGDTGAPGASGYNGTAGPKGDPGTPGTKGDPGTPGTKGDPGTPGTKGDPGTPGTKGDPGTPGTKGDPGTPGTKGDPGTPGTKGDPGTNGASDADVVHQTGSVTLHPGQSSQVVAYDTEANKNFLVHAKMTVAVAPSNNTYNGQFAVTCTLGNSTTGTPVSEAAPGYDSATVRSPGGDAAGTLALTNNYNNGNTPRHVAVTCTNVGNVSRGDGDVTITNGVLDAAQLDHLESTSAPAGDPFVAL